ncbi:MAG: hypothetical protein LQ343_005986 [Gyalolechia ehrenbergii]|nr:MAG: hypothetical protein LQ343_005986 [Gyalolechia ehrenbergii]
MEKPAIRRQPGSTTAPDQRSEPTRVDNDIRSRTWSLLALPNEKRSPSAPCPTPAGARTAANSEDDEVSVSSGRADNHGSAHLKPSFLRAANPEPFASNYDGPAGHVAESVPNGTPKRSAQNGIGNDLVAEGDGRSVSATQKSPAMDPLSRSRRSLRELSSKTDADGPRRVRSTISKTKTPTNPRRSLYNLKPTSSADSQPVEKRSRRAVEDPKLRMNHVPGSFRSEYETSIRDSRSPSPSSTNSYTTVTVHPLQGRSFESVSSRGLSNNDTPSSNQNPSLSPIVSPDIDADTDKGEPAMAIPFLRPMLSSYTIHEAPSLAALRAYPAPQPTSLQNVVDSFEGQPPDSELIHAVEATSNQAMTPDLGGNSAVAAVDFQIPGQISNNPDIPKEDKNFPLDGKALAALPDLELHSSEPNHGRDVATSETPDTGDHTPTHVSPRVSHNPAEEDKETLPRSAYAPQGEQQPIASLREPIHQNTKASSSNSEPGPAASWMRQLLARKSAPAMGQAPPNLTARPRYRSRKVADGLDLHRSKTLPAQTDQAPSNIEQPKGPESFARVITDLEDLLQQALQIAGQANDKTTEGGTSEKPPLLRQGSTSQMRNVQEHETSYVSFHSSDEDTSSGSTGLDEEENRTTAPTRYTDRHGARITLVEPDEADQYHSQFKAHHNATRYRSAPVEGEDRPPSLGNVDVRSRSLADPRQQIVSGDAQFGSTQQPMQITIRGDPADVQNVLLNPVGVTSSSVDAADWALKRKPTVAVGQYSEAGELQNAPRKASIPQILGEEPQGFIFRERRLSKTPAAPEPTNVSRYSGPKSFSSGDDKEPIAYFSDRPASEVHQRLTSRPKKGAELQNLAPQPMRREDTLSPLPSDIGGRGPGSDPKSLDLRHRHHFSIREPKMFSLSRSHRRSPIARDWSNSKKRWVALVACMNTALMGLIIGIYAGEVPAMQYNIVDEHHYVILGNVVLFIGLAISNSIFWPLPLLYGRKPFTLAALAILVPLQFPQAVAVSGFRTPYTPTYRVALLLSRAVAGLVMGFANINFIATLLDLFGASLQSVNPHQEIVNVNDVRRHGGGMGIWLGFWTWCFIGSLGVGFFIGAMVISGLEVDWGFWITIILTAFVLVLNVLVPEVRRSPYRRSVADVRTPTELSRRVARGEIKMHLYSTGPKWWVEEVVAGSVLCVRMLKQPGFLVLSAYIGWIYGQIVMIIVLLGALTSRYYRFRPQYVGLCVLAIPIGALLAVPFQRASVLSRSRQKPPRTDSMTVNKRLTWTSHFVRRAVFMVSLPFAGLAYTLASVGPEVSVAAPTVFAGMIGFLSNLAVAECNGIIMETYDTSDLQAGMTGRPRRNLPEEIRKRRTHFSSFPRVTAAFAVSQTFAFLIAAAATGVGGRIERRLGAQAATAVVAGILLILTLLLIAVVTRFKEVQIIPSQRYGTNVLSGPEDEWKPVIIGNPSGTTRRMSILELGNMTRWKEIRRRNRLTGLEGY